MTIKIASCDDISIANEVLNFNNWESAEDNVLAGASWLTATSSAYDSLLIIMRFVYAEVLKNLDKHKFWLLIGNSTWQPNTKIVRHKGLWEPLRARGVEIFSSNNSQERIHEKDGKIKFFGATRLSENSIESVTRALLNENCAYLISTEENTEINNILDIEWSGYLQDDSNLVNHIVNIGGLIFKKAGEFDDPERGLIAIGRSELVKPLVS